MKNILFFLILVHSVVYSQNINSSKAFVRSCYNSQQCFALSESAFIFYNEANHEIIITLDFKKFKLGNDTLDEWLDDLDDSRLVFKGTLNVENLLVLANHNAKTLKVNGVMTVNNVSHSHTIELTLFEIKQDGMLFINNSQDYYDRISANLQFAFSPKEFNLHKKKHHLKKVISVAIYKGVINKFIPGMEQWIN